MLKMLKEFLNILKGCKLKFQFYYCIYTNITNSNWQSFKFHLQYSFSITDFGFLKFFRWRIILLFLNNFKQLETNLLKFLLIKYSYLFWIFLLSLHQAIWIWFRSVSSNQQQSLNRRHFPPLYLFLNNFEWKL